MDIQMRKKIMELVDNIKSKLTHQDYIDFCTLLNKNDPYEPINLDGATLVKIRFNCIEIDNEELNVNEYTNIVQVVSDEESVLGGANLIFRGDINIKRLRSLAKRINWRNNTDEFLCSYRKNFCYEAIGMNSWIQPLEIEVLSRDKRFRK
ncbi:hypothetical protein [Bathycoccus sp. RCC716 virus 1]|uniref:Uncharacterized protein n=1 Tax=Bathycoccus sp. RCC716 virus 1 TaxID=2530038 RepID=A0A7S6P1N2_9PHYC|nr:hypothetical protein [Bathycoccus sp. RCC716 virus 1]|tara:strand:+ start:258 stop:707 length:450 start_codon:yes stop_codon:yes gene_type:complete